jgi:hypothetical protein
MSLTSTAKTYGRLISFTALVLILGCKDGRPSRVPVSGIVKIENQPLIAGENIIFQPTQGRPSSGPTDSLVINLSWGDGQKGPIIEKSESGNDP